MAIEPNKNKRIVLGEDIDVTVGLKTTAKKLHSALNELFDKAVNNENDNDELNKGKFDVKTDGTLIVEIFDADGNLINKGGKKLVGEDQIISTFSILDTETVKEVRDRMDKIFNSVTGKVQVQIPHTAGVNTEKFLGTLEFISNDPEIGGPAYFAESRFFSFDKIKADGLLPTDDVQLVLWQDILNVKSYNDWKRQEDASWTDITEADFLLLTIKDVRKNVSLKMEAGEVYSDTTPFETIFDDTKGKRTQQEINEKFGEKIKENLAKKSLFGDGTETTSQTGAGYSKGEADTKFETKANATAERDKKANVALDNVNVGTANAGKLFQVKADGGVEYVETEDITITETITKRHNISSSSMNIAIAGYTPTKIVSVGISNQSANSKENTTPFYTSDNVAGIGNQAESNRYSRATLNGNNLIWSKGVFPSGPLSVLIEYQKTITFKGIK